MRILISGGSGFIGSSLAKRLLEEEHEVLSYDLKPSPICESIVGNITDYEEALKAVGSCNYVFHLAAVANLNFARTHPQVAVDTNVQGTYTIAKCCAESMIPISFASTCCIFGRGPEHPSTERSLCVPTDIYGITKMVGEEILKHMRGLKYNILRFGTTYGPYMRKELAIRLFIEKALKDEPLTIHGSGKQTRCFIYVGDLLDALVKVLEREVQLRGETLNIASEEELSVVDVAEIILEEMGKPKSLLTYSEDRSGQIMREQIDISKTMVFLDWKPKVSFREGIKETIKWIQSGRI